MMSVRIASTCKCDHGRRHDAVKTTVWSFRKEPKTRIMEPQETSEVFQ
jgi:hypothetical protein